VPILGTVLTLVDENWGTSTGRYVTWAKSCVDVRKALEQDHLNYSLEDI
jgi:hypothetical protein